MRKEGSMLLELMIASALISVIMTGLMASLYQLHTTQARVDRVIFTYDRVSLLFHQLESDLTGVFLPIQNIIAPPIKENKPEVSTDKKEKADAASPKEVEKKEDKKEVKPITDIMIGRQNEGNLSFFSCVTCNPLIVFWGEKAGKAQPRVSRVIYRMHPDPLNKTSFILTRQQGNELSLEKYPQKKEISVDEYELIGGIKNIRISYIVAKQPEKTASAQEGQEKKGDAQKQALEAMQKPREYEIKNEWVVKQKEEKDEKKKSQEPEPVLIPDFVRIEVTLWDATFSREEKSAYTIALPIDMKSKLPSAVPDKEVKKKEDKPAAVAHAKPIMHNRPRVQRRPIRIVQGRRPTRFPNIGMS